MDVITHDGDDAPSTVVIALTLLRRGGWPALQWSVLLAPWSCAPIAAAPVLDVLLTRELGADSREAYTIAIWLVASLLAALPLSVLHGTTIATFARARQLRVGFGDTPIRHALGSWRSVLLPVALSLVAITAMAAGAGHAALALRQREADLDGALAGAAVGIASALIYTQVLLLPTITSMVERVGPIVALVRSFAIYRGRRLAAFATLAPIAALVAIAIERRTTFVAIPEDAVFVCIAVLLVPAYLIHVALAVAVYSVESAPAVDDGPAP